MREIWSPRPLISAGGYSRELALDVAETKGDIIAIGRLFISNVRLAFYWLSSSTDIYNYLWILQPDLVHRLQNDLPAQKGDRTKYYTYEDPVGYTDYPFVDGTVAPARFKAFSQPQLGPERASL